MTGPSHPLSARDAYVPFFLRRPGADPLRLTVAPDVSFSHFAETLAASGYSLKNDGHGGLVITPPGTPHS